MRIHHALVVVTVTTVALTGGVFAKADALEAQQRETVLSTARIDAQAERGEARSLYLADLVEIAQAETTTLAALIEVRPAFVTELKGLGAALAKADGKVSIDAHRAAALSAQQEVLAERTDPDMVTRATATIHALTGKVNEEVAAWEAEQRRLEEQRRLAEQRAAATHRGPSRSSSGGKSASSGKSASGGGGGSDGFSRVRAALNRVGGSGVGLYESASCAGGSAPACANSNGYIKYRSDIASWSTARLNWAMAHELAHIYQFRVWGSMNSSSSYHSLFGGNPESLANCMAVVRGYPGGHSCNGAQQAWASGIWVGAVR